MVWLVSIFSAADVNHQIRAGHFKGDDLSQMGPILSRLPRRGELLGMVLFIFVALIMVNLTVLMFSLFGIKELSVVRLALYKAIYTGPIAYFISYLAIIRQL